MQELRELLEPEWGSEKWILEGWQELTPEEKSHIRFRMDEMFRHGLPFSLKHQHLDYIRIFSLLAQLEVLAIQIPLKFASMNDDPVFCQQMREQLLDEVFHGLVFTKISFMLSAPYAYPPPYNSAIEELCNFVRNETCSKTAVILLNLIAEGWIEEFFNVLMKEQVAPKVFEVILADERRHVEDADLYCSLGLPAAEQLQEKINHIENLLLTQIIVDYRHISIFSALSIDKIDFLRLLNEKHIRQLKKINAKPSHRWHVFMQFALKELPHLIGTESRSCTLDISDTRKFLMTQWKNPQDPTMIGDFDLDISCLDYLSLKKGHHFVTLCLLQVVSKTLAEKNIFRRYLFHDQLRQAKHPFVALTTRLPSCGGALSYVVLENCHHLTLNDLNARIQYATTLQSYCFKKRQALEKRYPHLRQNFENIYHEIINGIYPMPFPSNAIVPVSSLISFGFAGGKSPLRPNEALKFTLFKVERKPAWDDAQKTFLPRDILPISCSADHRVLDANVMLPQLMKRSFERIYAKIQHDAALDLPTPVYDPTKIISIIDHFSEKEIDFVYSILCFLQMIWFDSLTHSNVESTDIFKKIIYSALQSASYDDHQLGF